MVHETVGCGMFWESTFGHTYCSIMLTEMQWLRRPWKVRCHTASGYKKIVLLCVEKGKSNINFDFHIRYSRCIYLLSCISGRQNNHRVDVNENLLRLASSEVRVPLWTKHRKWRNIVRLAGIDICTGWKTIHPKQSIQIPEKFTRTKILRFE